jgi:type II secretory pathway predicted ATPase ExeA
MLKLKQALDEAGKTQRELAQHLGISPAGVAQICNHGQFPKKPDSDTIRAGILRFLEQHGASVEVCRRAFDEVEVQQPEQPQEVQMIQLKKPLTPAAKKHFGMFRDPFTDAVESSEEVFVSPDIYDVLDSMMGTAKRGGFMAVVAESGAGKSTLVEEMEERLRDEAPEVMLIKPFVVGMEGDDNKGKRLKATSILDAILRRVAPDQPRRSLSLEDKSHATFMALQRSAEADKRNRHCLIIEEAHRLAVPTLRHLKGFHEMKIGRTPLLSILLVGQNELDKRLNPVNTDLREVIQRCQVVHLPPLDNYLEAYLKFKLERAGKAISEVIDNSGIEQIRARLSETETSRTGRIQSSRSLLYPLAVSNLMSRSMNEAARIGMPRVNADAVNSASKQVMEV